MLHGNRRSYVAACGGLILGNITSNTPPSWIPSDSMLVSAVCRVCNHQRRSRIHMFHHFQKTFQHPPYPEPRKNPSKTLNVLTTFPLHLCAGINDNVSTDGSKSHQDQRLHVMMIRPATKFRKGPTAMAYLPASGVGNTCLSAVNVLSRRCRCYIHAT